MKPVRILESRFTPWLLPVALITFWQILSKTGTLPERILPSPAAVSVSAWVLLKSGELLKHIAISSLRAFGGLAIGGTAGLVLGLVTGLNATAFRLLDTPIQMLRTIPNLALIPIVIVWFGIGEEARVFLISVGVFFPLYVNTLHGIRNADAGLVEMARVYGLSNRAVLTQVILPASLPSILNGLRLALGIMWVTLIAAETLAAEAGIGYMTYQAREFLRTDIVLVGILVYALLGKLADVISRGLERRLLPWHNAYAR